MLMSALVSLALSNLPDFIKIEIKIPGDFCLPPSYDCAVPPAIPTYVTIAPHLLEVSADKCQNLI